MNIKPKNQAKILIVEDEPSMRGVLEILLEEEGYSTVSAQNGKEAIELIEKDIFDLVITDIRMPIADGFEVLKKVKEVSPDTVVIMITAFGTSESAIEAIKQGAYDYIHKPFKIDEIRVVIRRAIEKKFLLSKLNLINEKIKSPTNIIYRSQAMHEIMEKIQKIAGTNSSVLITGESGVGKELIAREIHNLSPRKLKEFVAINCSTLPEGLLESELFGHMKGAFTGAHYNKKGLFEVADGGTLFLDEIGEMPQGLQAKLLRVLEDNTFRRVGGVSDIKVDVRIISATNKDLNKEVEKGNFREDLFFRLNVIPIHIPPLRERKEDIPILVEYLLKKYATVKKVSKDAMHAIMNYQWKGNVRELENVIERIALLCEDEEIRLSDLPPEIISSTKEMRFLPDLTKDGIDLDKVIEELEKQYITKALQITNNTKIEAAKILGLSFRSFRYRLRKYNIDI